MKTTVKLRKAPVPEIRGSLCVDTVAHHIETITPRGMENFFNRCIQQLAKQGVFPKKINAACDATLYETTSKFKGCGSVTRTVKVKTRGYRKIGELKEVPVTLYGWKVWAVKELEAEATAFVVSRHFGLHTKAPTYLALYRIK